MKAKTRKDHTRIHPKISMPCIFFVVVTQINTKKGLSRKPTYSRMDLVTFGSKYSRLDQVKFMDNSLENI